MPAPDGGRLRCDGDLAHAGRAPHHVARAGAARPAGAHARGDQCGRPECAGSDASLDGGVSVLFVFVALCNENS